VIDVRRSAAGVLGGVHLTVEDDASALDGDYGFAPEDSTAWARTGR
jgi:hypothetical protein